MISLLIAQLHAHRPALAVLANNALLRVLSWSWISTIFQLISLSTSKSVSWCFFWCALVILPWPWCFTAFVVRSLASPNSPLRPVSTLLQLVLTRPWSIFLPLTCTFPSHRILRSFWSEFRVIPSWSWCLTSFHFSSSTRSHHPARSVLRLTWLVRSRSW